MAIEPLHSRAKQNQRLEEERRKQQRIEKGHKRLLAAIFKDELEANLLEKRRRRTGEI